jgi:hypothetical protein
MEKSQIPAFFSPGDLTEATMIVQVFTVDAMAELIPL